MPSCKGHSPIHITSASFSLNCVHRVSLLASSLFTEFDGVRDSVEDHSRSSLSSNQFKPAHTLGRCAELIAKQTGTAEFAAQALFTPQEPRLKKAERPVKRESALTPN